MVELGLEQQLYRDSHLLTKLQWSIGPLRGQFGCWRASTADVDRDRFDWNRRCKSSACKPGDPYGCSMLKAREYSERTRNILDGWLGADHHAYVSLFEIKGEPGDSLRSVLKTAQAALHELFAGKRWIIRRDRFRISGQITTLSIAKSANGGWVVRRWLVLGVDGELAHEEQSDLREFLEGLWARSIERAGQVAKRIEALQPISHEDVPGLSQLITGCISPLDPVPVMLDSDLEDAIGAPAHGEESISDLAGRYVAESAALTQLFGRFDGRIGLIRADGDGFRVRCKELSINKAGRRRFLNTIHAVELPERARDFAEYATESFGASMWTVSGSSVKWKCLIEQASELRIPYLPIPDMPELNRPGGRNAKK